MDAAAATVVATPFWVAVGSNTVAPRNAEPLMVGVVPDTVMLVGEPSAAPRVMVPGPLELVLRATVYCWVAPVPSVLPGDGAIEMIVGVTLTVLIVTIATLDTAGVWATPPPEL